MSGEPCPAVHFEQQFGDLDARERCRHPIYQMLRSLRNGGVERGDLQALIGQDGIGKLIGLRQAVYDAELFFDPGKPPFKIPLTLRYRQQEAARALAGVR